MIKIVYCLHRLPHLSRTEFHDHWRSVHGPLVAERAALLGIRRYVQCHTLDDASTAHLAALRGGVGAYDGVAELWLDGVGAGRPVPSAQAQRAAHELLEDERRFIDLSRSCLFVAEEHEVVPLD